MTLIALHSEITPSIRHNGSVLKSLTWVISGPAAALVDNLMTFEIFVSLERYTSRRLIHIVPSIHEQERSLFLSKSLESPSPFNSWGLWGLIIEHWIYFIYNTYTILYFFSWSSSSSSLHVLVWGQRGVLLLYHLFSLPGSVQTFKKN